MKWIDIQSSLQLKIINIKYFIVYHFRKYKNPICVTIIDYVIMITNQLFVTNIKIGILKSHFVNFYYFLY